jgi:hypothetical protein
LISPFKRLSNSFAPHHPDSQTSLHLAVNSGARRVPCLGQADQPVLLYMAQEIAPPFSGNGSVVN